jgi:DNA-binding response OmpR family regulator
MASEVPMCVLVVDDDPQFAEVLAAALRCAGARPLIVGNVGSARVEWNRGGWGLCLLDLTLPDSLPDETVRAIPEILAAGVPRVVVITGSPVTPGLTELCRKWGAADVLGKDTGFLEKVTALVRR